MFSVSVAILAKQNTYPVQKWPHQRYYSGSQTEDEKTWTNLNLKICIQIFKTNKLMNNKCWGQIGQLLHFTYFSAFQQKTSNKDPKSETINFQLTLIRNLKLYCFNLYPVFIISTTRNFTNNECKKRKQIFVSDN